MAFACAIFSIPTAFWLSNFGKSLLILSLLPGDRTARSQHVAKSTAACLLSQRILFIYKPHRPAETATRDPFSSALPHSSIFLLSVTLLSNYKKFDAIAPLPTTIHTHQNSSAATHFTWTSPIIITQQPATDHYKLRFSQLYVAQPLCPIHHEFLHHSRPTIFRK
jgi:hypothetical protein